MLNIEPVERRPRLYKDIAERLERLMISGELKPGDLLPSERDLMTALGVGRTAVREALFALNRMGLVALQNGERAVVTQPTPTLLVAELSGAARHMLAQPTGVRHFQHARALFEVALARDAARHASADDVVSLEVALLANEEAIADRQRFIETDVAFHFVLAQITRNPIFTALHTAIAEWLKEQRATSAGQSGSPEAACRAHRRIYEAIARADADAAEAAMAAHLGEVERFYWQSREGGTD